MTRRTGYIFRRGKYWYVQVRFAGQRKTWALHTTNRDEAKDQCKKKIGHLRMVENAEDYIAWLRMELAQTESNLESLQSVPIADAWETYLSSPRRRAAGPETVRDYESHWRQFCVWLTAHHPKAKNLADITSKMAEDWSRALTLRHVSPGRHNKHVAFLCRFFRMLTGHPASPFDMIARKRVEHHSRRELTAEELSRVIRAATGEIRTLFLIGAYTGLRLHDAATLRWNEIDFRARVIRRVQSKTSRFSAVPVIVPIHDHLVNRLREIRSKAEYVMPQIGNLYQNNRQNLSKRIQAHFRACGIETRNAGHTVVGFHSLRHTFVSMCRAADVPLAVVESIVGHSSPAMTRHYTHVGASAAVDAIRTLPHFSVDTTRKGQIK